MTNINLLSRLEAIAQTCYPIISRQNGVVKIVDQPLDPVRNQNNLLFVGIESHKKLDFQKYDAIWDATNEIFNIYGKYTAINTIFFDYYPVDYSGLDVCQTLALTLNYTSFLSQNMSSYGFTDISNLSDPDITQSVLKQRWRFTIKFMCYDNIFISTVYRTEKITVSGTLGNLDIALSVNLS